MTALKLATLSLALLAMSCANSGAESNNALAKAAEVQRNEPLQLTALEEQARTSLAAKRAERDASALEARVRRAMERDLFDPFSARFRELRAGRGGAVCGEYNAKNRMGAYVGFKDFVLSRDGRTIYFSSYNDGVRSALYGSFADAYLNVCASSSERRAHASATYVPSYDDEGMFVDADGNYIDD